MRHTVLAAVLILVAGWGLSRPVPECPDREVLTATLSCELAVSAALGALPADRAVITRIQFLYGSLIPLYLPLLGQDEQPTIGYVLFTYNDGSREYVDLIAWHGELTAAGPEPYPHSAAAQATTVGSARASARPSAPIPLS